MSYTKLFIHAVWSTKNQKPLLTLNIRDKVLSHIMENARKRCINIIALEGSIDHLHALIKVHPTQNLSQLIHNIKGESSNWINDGKLSEIHFEWQESFIAVSMSSSGINRLKEYFSDHNSHHSEMTLSRELKLLKTEKLFRLNSQVDFISDKSIQPHIADPF